MKFLNRSNSNPKDSLTESLNSLSFEGGKTAAIAVEFLAARKVSENSNKADIEKLAKVFVDTAKLHVRVTEDFSKNLAMGIMKVSEKKLNALMGVVR